MLGSRQTLVTFILVLAVKTFVVFYYMLKKLFQSLAEPTSKSEVRFLQVPQLSLELITKAGESTSVL